MDRQIVYAGSIPLDTDLLSIQRNVQVAIGALARVVLGTNPVVDGLFCAPAAGAYCVTVTAGSLTMLTANDFWPFGALAADPTPTMRTGQLPDNVVVQLGRPPDVGHVVCWLVQALITELDGAPIALPYWNAANPELPYTGPGNTGQAQPTTRMLRIQLAGKPNAPQPWPIGTPPEPDPGWVGLCSVLTTFDKPGIEAGDITPFHGMPRVRFPLPALPPGLTSQAVYSTSTTWTAPDLVRWARVRVLGAGGGGGGGDADYSGGGGGAGGYSEAVIAVLPQQEYVILIGAGGAGSQPGATGVNGGETSFGGGLLSATGGAGGGSKNPDSHGGGPGQGIAGALLQPGGYGGDGAAVALIPAGNGGASAMGGGGRGSDQGGAPANGSAAGSGGGGAYGVLSVGGAGAGGLVIIEY